MEKNYISEIITGYINHRYNAETETKLQQWLVDGSNEAEKNRALTVFWNSISPKSEAETYRSLAKLKTRLNIETSHKKTLSRRKWIAVAAVLFPVLILLGSYFYYNATGFGNSKTVSFSVPYGENREINLPDGSTVFLNAGSDLQYTERKNIRHINLNGEAFFSVVKDVSKPFIIKTENIQVEAIGTEFNVKAYRSENKATATLNSGIIKVKTKDRHDYILEPNYQLSYDNHKKNTVVKSVNADDFSNWRRNGQMVFDDTSLRDILSNIERKFNIKILTDELIPLNDHYSIKFVNNENLSEIMEILGNTGNFSCHIDGKNITLIRK